MLVLAASGRGVWPPAGLTSMFVVRLVVTVVLGVPGAALLAALVVRQETWVQVAAFAAAGAVLGFELARWAVVPGTTGFAWLEAGVAAGAGRWLVARRDSRRGVSGTPGRVGTVEGPGAGPGDGGLRWEGPLAWLVASLGLLVVPLWSGFAATITLAGFFGSVPTESDHAQAARYLWFGAGVAVAAAVTVLVLARRVSGRGDRLRGRVALPTLGGVVASVLASAASTA